MESSHKRQRDDEADSDTPESLSRAISPPRKKSRPVNITKSPWQLTWIRDLPEAMNRDAVSLRDLLGDPLIAECWQFNYLHDVPFVMDAFDVDTKHLVKLHVVHGFWKREDPNRLMLVQEAADFKNVELHCAPMPEMFGTHHSKMMILFRHDDTAQVIIHTANMIAKDWTNLTNAVWKSPMLPKATSPNPSSQDPQDFPVGSGERFRIDLISYLRQYDSRRVTCKPLVDKLAEYDFSSIKAALIASVPGRHDIRDLSSTTWGWAALKRCLRTLPVAQGDAEVVVQISSIATLGAKDDWLQQTIFGTLAASKNKDAKKPKFKVVFPTADEIRRSLDGYASGASIHTKIQSSQQAKQLQYLQPIFHHWANDCATGAKLPEDAVIADGGRNRAAPHIKTYIRFNQNKSIDWALLTSANLSKQAWGEAVRSTTGDVRIASWEIGVLVWPELLHSDGVMVGSFQSDTPDSMTWEETGGSLIGLRVPYSLPLQGYRGGEVPWVATMAHAEPDWKGLGWGE
ncbi:putative tyrosyl-DNA phosphodiesterase [Cladobotryum mycophilum]|uniref:Tyrosyl-DNA phosphodiesterase n=1 Tax=Cladobotryum mycophilum TaxID=491253 RepID=A0ABR0T384_9HYPO